MKSHFYCNKYDKMKSHTVCYCKNMTEGNFILYYNKYIIEIWQDEILYFITTNMTRWNLIQYFIAKYMTEWNLILYFIVTNMIEWNPHTLLQQIWQDEISYFIATNMTGWNLISFKWFSPLQMNQGILYIIIIKYSFHRQNCVHHYNHYCTSPQIQDSTVHKFCKKVLNFVFVFCTNCSPF